MRPTHRLTHRSAGPGGRALRLSKSLAMRRYCHRRGGRQSRLWVSGDCALPPAPGPSRRWRARAPRPTSEASRHRTTPSEPLDRAPRCAPASKPSSSGSNAATSRARAAVPEAAVHEHGNTCGREGDVDSHRATQSGLDREVLAEPRASGMQGGPQRHLWAGVGPPICPHDPGGRRAARLRVVNDQTLRAAQVDDRETRGR